MRPHGTCEYVARQGSAAALSIAVPSARFRSGPAQTPTDWMREALRHHPLALKLPLSFSPARLDEDLSRIPDAWWARHLGPFHDGAWDSVSLWAPGGDMRQQRSFGAPFAATPALESCPYIAEVLNALPGRRNRIRLMRLKAGGRILRHSDPLHTISTELVRIHIPIRTFPGVSFLINDKVLPLRPGEAWLIDVRFPHQVSNDSGQHRVHLVVDLIRDEALRQLLDQAARFGRGSLLSYYVKHSLPRDLRRRFGIGN